MLPSLTTVSSETSAPVISDELEVFYIPEPGLHTRTSVQKQLF